MTRVQVRSVARASLVAGFLLAFVAACGGGSDDVESASSTPAATAETTASATSIPPDRATATAPAVEPPAEVDFESRLSLPTRDLEFRVRAPDNHPAGAPLVLMTMPPGNVIWTDRIELEEDDATPGIYVGTAEVERGALLRYTYDRWDAEDIAEFASSRETVEDVYGFLNRYVLVTDDLALVEDTVALWRDIPGPDHDGSVTGTVSDSVTGSPIMDATVSVSGVHTATDWQGKFRVNDLPDGAHRAVVFTTLGDHRAGQAGFEIAGGSTADLAISLEPAAAVSVTFDVELPEDTPPDAEIAIAGNLWQLGGRLFLYPFKPDALAVPALDRHGSRRATLTVDLYEGTYVNYTYSLRSVAEGFDRSDSGAVFRSFIVDPREPTRSDEVDRWQLGDWPITTIRVTVPSDTSPGVPVGIRTGPTAWMSPSGPNEWVAHNIHNPPGSEFDFVIVLGDDMAGLDGSPEAVDGKRTVTIPEDGGEIRIEVTRWERSPDSRARQADGGLDVTFRLTVPPETPDGAEIFLSGNRAALANPVLMIQRSDNPWVYEATVTFAHDGELTYRYGLDDPAAASRQSAVFTAYDGQLVNDRVSEWDGLPPDADSSRAAWRSGIYLPDFWSMAFVDSSESTFQRIRDVAAGQWVAISSVWSFGQLQPVPTVEQRPHQIWTVLTPIEDIRFQAALAHELGLKVFLAPQQNPEVLPGWNDAPLNVWDQAWWEAWLLEAERQWMWNAVLAEEIGAEMLMLPGPVFHVFPNSAQFDDDPFQSVVDEAIADMVEQVRSVYSGLIIMSGNNDQYDFPELADFRGVTTFDLGVPSLDPTASVADWKDAYRERFEAVVDPIHERWDGPVMFYTIHAPSSNSGQFEAPAPAGDPHGELVQANRLEAIFQLIDERPWIEGAYSWAYNYIDAPAETTDGVRGRLGEAVQAKWYERFSAE